MTLAAIVERQFLILASKWLDWSLKFLIHHRQALLTDNNWLRNTGGREREEEYLVPRNWASWNHQPYKSNSKSTQYSTPEKQRVRTDGSCLLAQESHMNPTGSQIRISPLKPIFKISITKVSYLHWDTNRPFDPAGSFICRILMQTKTLSRHHYSST